MKFIVALCFLSAMKVDAWPLMFQAQFEELTYDDKKGSAFWDPIDEQTTVLPTMMIVDTTRISEMTTSEIEEETTAAERFTTGYGKIGEFTTGDATTAMEVTSSDPEDVTTEETATESPEIMEEVTTGESEFYEDYWYGETTASPKQDNELD